MTKQEIAFLDMALSLVRERKTTKWWKFRKRYKLGRERKSALECMIRYGKE